jgi:hypothetical protein
VRTLPLPPRPELQIEHVEVPVEGNLVADFGFVVVNPCVGHMGQNFALEVFLHVIIERHVFGIAQAAVWLRLALVLALGYRNDVGLLILQWPLHGDGAVAEVHVLEDAADGCAVPLRLLELAEEARDLSDVFVAQLLALAGVCSRNGNLSTFRKTQPYQINDLQIIRT